MNHLTASRERKPQPAQSHDRCDRARGMCGARPPGIAALNAGNSEFPNIQSFRHIVILRIFCFGWTLLSCPLLSCSVVTLVSDRCPNQCGRKADRMRTRTPLARSERGWVGNASPRGTIDPVPGTSRARRRADTLGHLSESKRTECGRKADRCPHRSGQNADRMRTGCGRGLASGACRLRGRRRVSGRPAHRVDGRRGSPRTILPQFSPTRSVEVGLSR